MICYDAAPFSRLAHAIRRTGLAAAPWERAPRRGHQIS